jgi:hypothetical protein
VKIEAGVRFMIFAFLLSFLPCLRTFIRDVLTAWSRILLKKLIVTELVKKCPAFLWHQKFRYHFHKSSPPVCILNQMHPVHTYSNIIFPSTHRSSELSLPLIFSEQNFVCSYYRGT